MTTTTTVAGKQTTSGDDLIYGLSAGDFQSADIINAGAGNDTLDAVIANAEVVGLLTSVENLKITANVKSDAVISGGSEVDNREASTLDLSKATGVNSVAFKAVDTVKATFDGSADGVATATLTGLSSKDTAISLAGTAGGKTSGQDETLDVKVIYDYATLSGASDTVKLTLNSTNKADVIVMTNTDTVATGDKEGAETIELVSSTVASSIGTIASTKQDASTGVLTTLKVTGDAALTIGDVVSFATDATKSVAATVDASSFAKKLTGTFAVASNNDAITVNVGNGGSALTITSSGSTASSAVVSVTTGTGADSVTVTDIGTRTDDSATTTVDETKITNITVATGDGKDTITITAGNVSVNAGAGDDTLVLTTISSGIDMLDKYDTIDLGEGTDTVKTSDATINATDKTDVLSRISNAEIIETTATGEKTIDLTAITGFKTAKASAHSASSAASAASTAVAGNDGLDLISDNTTGNLIIAAAIVGQAGGAGNAVSVAGAAGGVGLDLNAKLDNGANTISLTFVDNADITGGAGAAGVNGATTSANGNGGAGSYAIDAREYETVNVALSATDTTADTVAFTKGAAGGAGTGGSGTAGSAGTAADAAIFVGNNATINVTETLAAADSSGTALTDQYSSINFGVIKGDNVNVVAGTVRGAVTIGGVSGNTTITTGSGSDVITAGTGIDTISVGTGDDSVTAKASADVITLGLAGNAAVVVTSDYANGGTLVNESAAGGYDSITGFTLASASWTGVSSGNDTVALFQSTNAAGTNLNADILDINILNTGGSANTLAVAAASSSAGTTATSSVQVGSTGLVSFATADNTLAKKLVAVAADDTDVGAGKAVFFEDSGNTYVFVSNEVGTTETADIVIELVGVTGALGMSLLASTGTVGGAGYIIIG